MNNTGVDVTFEEVTELVEGAVIKVTSPTGKEVEVKALDLEIGDTNVEFTFVTALEEIELGTWKIEGIDYDYSAQSAAEAVESANTQIKLWNALQSDYFKDTDIDNIDRYETLRDDLVTNGAKFTVKLVQESIIDEGNLGDQAAAAVEAVQKATNQITLLKALESPAFKRVNPDHIAFYAAEATLFNAGDNDLPAFAGGVTDVQTAIDKVNLERVQAEYTAAETALSRTGYTKTLELANALEDGAAKDAELAKLVRLDLVLKVNEASTNASLQSALNALVTNVNSTATLDGRAVYPILMSQYRAGIAAEPDVTNKNTAAGIYTVIQGVNDTQVVNTLNTISGITTATPLATVKTQLERLAAITPNDGTVASALYGIGATDWLAPKQINEQLIEAYRTALDSNGASITTPVAVKTDVKKVRVKIETANTPDNAINALKAATTTDIVDLLNAKVLNLKNVSATNKDYYLAELAVHVATAAADPLQNELANAKAVQDEIVTKGNQVAAFDAATTATEVRTAIAPFGVSSTDYVDLSTNQRLDLAQLILNDIALDTPVATYENFDEIATNVDNAAEELVDFLKDTTKNSADNINMAANTSAILAFLNNDASRNYVVFADFEELSPQEKINVATAIFENRPAVTTNTDGDVYISGGYKTIAEILAQF